MSTPDFEVHRGVVQHSDPATGLSKVRIPALLGADGVVDVPSLGLTYENGFWNVPDVGSHVFVAVSRDRLDFLWLTAITIPTSGGSGDVVDSLQFNIDANITVESEGLLAWNEDWGTVDIGLHGSNAVLHVGQQVYYYAKNQTGAQIDKGTVVRFDGALGASGHLKMAPFLADGTYPSEYIMGITAHDIPDGDDGYVVHFGAVRGVDTATPGWSAGDVVYASPTVTGGLTSTAPSAPNNIILVAAVVNSHAQNGELFVRPTLAANILNDEGIVYTNLADNDVLAYNATTGVFENTPVPASGSDGQIQYNDGGSLGAIPTLTYNDTTGLLQVEGDVRFDGDTLFVDASADSVGIGTTTPTAQLTFGNTIGNKIDLYHTTAGSGDRYGIQIQSSELRIHSGAGGSGTGGITLGKSDTTTFTEHMRITNDGNVGIGTATPDYLLTIEDTTPIVTVRGANTSYAEIRAHGSGSGTGAVYVGQASNYGGGVFYNGDGSPSYATGEAADRISFFRRNGGSNEVVFSYPYNGNTVTFRGNTYFQGNVGIKDPSPQYALDITGTFRCTSSAYVNNSLTVGGYLSKQGGGFRIPHPHPDLNETHDLVHNFVEAPQADNIYRGRVQLSDGTASVNIDTASGMTAGTFVLLNRDIQCFTSNEEGPCGVWGYVEGSTLHVTAQHSDCNHTISWMVIGERQDEFMITGTDATDDNGKVIVEPLKREDTSSDFVVVDEPTAPLD